MRIFYLHWARLGAVAAVALGAWLALTWRGRGALDDLLWLSLISLFVHQCEEYLWPGGFPRMLNTVLFASATPDRYPLNARTAFMVNVCVGWGSYALAAVLGARAPWLAIATILVSAANFVAHAFVFNIKGRTWWNPGQTTAIVLFVPMTLLVLRALASHPSTTRPSTTLMDWLGGIALGAALNYFGILKPITLFADRETPFRFEPPNG